MHSELQRECGFESSAGFRFHQPAGPIKAHEEVAIGVNVLQGVIEGAESQCNADGQAEIESTEIGVREGKRSACAKAEVDGVKDRRLAAVAGPDQAIYPRFRRPAKALNRAKVFDLKQTDQRNNASPARSPRGALHRIGGFRASRSKLPVLARATLLNSNYNTNALDGMV
jgi:hypothetical protein